MADALTFGRFVLTEITDFAWPHPDDPTQTVRWTGHGFSVGSELRPLLSFERGVSGWSNELETFEGEAAGASHFIDRASRSWAVQQLRRWMPSDHPVILDIGCAAGHFLKTLQQSFPGAALIGADYVIESLQRLASDLPGIPFLHFDVITCPLPDARVDAVTLLNVLEHVPDDRGALEQVRRILKPGGVALIEVPAGPDLYDIYDEMYLHQRRYELNALCDTVHAANLEVVARSHLGFFIYPGFKWTKRRNQRLMSLDRKAKQEIVERNIRTSGDNPTLDFVTRFELLLGRQISFPMGVRCLVAARRVD